MTPEEYKKAAEELSSDPDLTEETMLYVQMGILEALLQMEICSHGTRGFCSNCFWAKFNHNQPITTRPWR